FDQAIKHWSAALSADGPHQHFHAARDAMAKCYASYSKFPVVAASRTQDGRVCIGANIENASFPEGGCAETTALDHCVMGGGGKIVAAAGGGGKMGRLTPCGACRQRLDEFAGPDAMLLVCVPTAVVETLAMRDVLPLGFAGDTLR